MRATAVCNWRAAVRMHVQELVQPHTLLYAVHILYHFLGNEGEV